MNTRSREIATGTVLDGRYRVDGVLGYGGFSTVYQAHHVHIDRPVALKVLDAGLEVETSENAIQRFLLEAKAAARIEHPNVVAIHDVGITPMGHPYIVMQRFDGETLHHFLLHQGGIAPERFLPLYARCLDGLAVAHRAGIVHRDLKPQNLVFTDPGTSNEAIKIIDFGTVQLLDDQAQLTAAGHIIGTMAYLSPEYVRRKEVSPAMDVYQMGLVLVESLRGRRVVQASNPLDYAAMHAEGRLDIPESLLASALGDVLASALAVRVEDRYANADEFAAALRAVDPSEVPNVAEVAILTAPDKSGTSEELMITTARTMALVTSDLQVVQGLQEAARTVLTPMPDVDPVARRAPAAAVTTAPARTTPATVDGGRLWLTALGGAVIALLIVVVVLVVVRGTGEVATATPAPAVDRKPVPVQAVPVAKAVPATKVELVAKPSSAAFIVDGNHVGSGRATLLFTGDQDREGRRVEVRADGFVPQSLNVTPSSAPKLEVTLTPVPAVAAPAPQVEAPKPKATAPAARPPASERPKRARRAPKSAPAKAKPAAPPKKKKADWKLID